MTTPLPPTDGPLLPEPCPMAPYAEQQDETAPDLMANLQRSLGLPERPAARGADDTGQDDEVEQVARAMAAVVPGVPGPTPLTRAMARAALAARPSADTETLRDALRVHHPIMRSETGPFSGCRCKGVGLGEDVIAHVVGHLAAALDGGRP